MATDTAVAKNAMAGYIVDAIQANGTASPNVAAQAEVSRLRKKQIVCWPLLADEAMASTATDVVVWRTPAAGAWRLASARYVAPAAGLTADNTNFATLAIKWNDDAGGAQTTVGSVATTVAGSGTWTANRSVNIPLATDPSVPAASAIHFTTTKSGTGVIVRAGILMLEFEEV